MVVTMKVTRITVFVEDSGGRVAGLNSAQGDEL